MPSASPHIKVILPPFLLLRSRYLYPFWTWRLLKIKTKSFSYYYAVMEINLYLKVTVLTLPYPNLTWLLSSFGVKLDNGVGPNAPRSPPG